MAETAAIGRCSNCALLLLPPKDAVEPRTARVEELLRQNHPPLDVELTAFHKIAEDARATLEDLDSKIVQARELLENLLSARQRTQSRLEDTKSLLHPMRSIPNEILAEIFHHCGLKPYSAEDPDALDPKSSPWLLTRVCHRWRELAINLPELWTYLLLDFDKQRPHITGPQCAYKVGLFNERSRGLPVTAFLGSLEGIIDHPVVPVLEASIPRWEYLDVDLPQSSLQCLSGNNFLKLHTLVIWASVEDEWHLNLDVFKSASTPVLRTLEISVDTPWRALEHVVLPWSHLTSIVCFPAFDADGLKTLRTLAHLENLDVVANVSDTHTPIRDIVALPKLRRLTITEDDMAAGRSKEFFSALAIPALSELTLKYHAASITHFPTSLSPLENLTKLDITCDMNSHVENTQHVLNFLTLTHRVEWFSVCACAMTREFVDGLNLVKLTDNSPTRLPCLRFLDMGKCDSAPSLAEDWNPLFEMLCSRLQEEAAERTEVVAETDSVHSSDHAGTGGSASGQNTSTNDGGAVFRLESKYRYVFLKRLRIPRRLYVQMRRGRPDIFQRLTSQLELECAVQS